MLLNMKFVHTDSLDYMKINVWGQFRGEEINVKCHTLKVTPLGIVKCESSFGISQPSCEDEENRDKALGI